MRIYILTDSFVSKKIINNIYVSIQQYTVSGHLQYSDLDKLTCFRYDIAENR